MPIAAMVKAMVNTKGTNMTAKTVTLATTATPAPKKARAFAFSASDILDMVLAEGRARAKLVESISEANHASPELMYDVQAARDWLRESKELRLAQKPLRFASFDLKAKAHHLAMVKGTTSKRKAEKSEGKQLLISEDQARHNNTHRQYWSRLLIDAGVQAVNSGLSGNNNAAKNAPKKPPKNAPKKREAAPIFASKAKAAAYFQSEAGVMLKVLNANRRAGSISDAAVKAYKSAVADFQLAVARAAKVK
jgi:hypothetical protein